ncbi:uncharacterized protein [Linepithema humile]|uniref:uncharacterized protein n=1 Tax=Linepithema humile TaxID=83485 RepID=UPI00351E1AC0
MKSIHLLSIILSRDVYHIDKRCNRIYRCASRRSLGCYAVLVQNQDETYTLRTSHNHLANETMLQEIEIKQEMLRICRETIMKPKDVFDMVCQRNPAVAKKISYRTMRSFLYREQIRQRPKIPQTIDELEIKLMNYRAMERIYKGTVLSDNGYRAVLFTTDALLNALVAATEIFMDGTFSVVPRMPSFVQLYIIYIRYMDTGIPVLFALCEKRTIDVYNAIWQRVKELHPNALQGVQSIMIDYEHAAMTVAKRFFQKHV